jgi:Protein kinase domain
MICPRCGNEWDVSKGPCSRCGLAIRMPGQTKSAPSSPLPLQKGTGLTNGLSLSRQPSGGLPSALPPIASQPAPTVPISQRGPTSSSGPLRPSTSSFPPNLPRPSTPPLTPSSGTPLSSRKVSPGQDALGTRSIKGDTPFGQVRPEVASPATDILSKNPTPRTPLPPRVHRFTDPLPQDRQLQQSQLRSSRLVSDMLKEQVQIAQPHPLSQSGPQSQPGLNASSARIHMLLPGAILHNGRYRLFQLQDRQDWAPGAFEAMWIGQDAQRGASQVMICEVVLPNLASITTQSKLRAATMTLATVTRHPRVPTLLDAFSEQERTFFVFEPVDGESLLSRMQRSGRALPEQEVIECCLQIAEVLDILSQQAPPLVHGLIRPEHIFVRYPSSEYILTHYSILLAGGATQIINLTERPSPYAAPELIHGIVDGRSDIYSLLATAYHLLTGSPPTEIAGSIPQAQRLNPNLSAQFDAILAKGLRSNPNQRYQRPSELIQDLLARPSVNGSLVSNADRAAPASIQPQSPKSEPSSSTTKDSAAQALPLLLTPVEDVEERALLLPGPEELPPMVEGDDRRNAAIWLGILLVCMIIIVLVSGRLF